MSIFWHPILQPGSQRGEKGRQSIDLEPFGVLARCQRRVAEDLGCVAPSRNVGRYNSGVHTHICVDPICFATACARVDANRLLQSCFDFARPAWNRENRNGPQHPLELVPCWGTFPVKIGPNQEDHHQWWTRTTG